MSRAPHGWISVATLLALVLGLAGSAGAADKKKPAKKKVADPLERPSRDTSEVYTDPTSADSDFDFVGEYRGFEWTTATGRSSRSISLQINAVGDGRFVATKMFGGTPAEPSTSNTPIALEGVRASGRVELIGPRFRYIVNGQYGYVINDRNTVIGKLERSGRMSPTIGRPAPEGAVVLFDGAASESLKNPRITEDGLLKAGTETADPWGDFQMHIEFRLPYKPRAFGQHRGNSGVYIQSRYEVQILDSFGWIPAFNDCSSLYRTKRPDRNATLPPLTWQTYDIDFRAARFNDAGEKTSPARLTVWLNGVTTHDDFAVPNKTGAGQKEGPQPLPIKFQDHRNPVVFRNMWIASGSAIRPDFRLDSEMRQDPTPVGLPTAAMTIVRPLP